MDASRSHRFGDAKALVLYGCLVFAILAQAVFSDLKIGDDSYRYVSMGLNLETHGVLTTSTFQPDVQPPPGIGFGGPLTALEIAAAARIDPKTRGEMISCVQKPKSGPGCDGEFRSLKAIYVLEMSVFAICVVEILFLFFSRFLTLLFCSLLALRFTVNYVFVAVLSEPLFLCACAVFLLTWLKAFDRAGQRILWLVSGAALGTTILVRPAYVVLPLFCVLFIFGVQWIRREFKTALAEAAIFAAGCTVVLLPLIVRNYVSLGVFALGDPLYLVHNLAQRLAYNRMPMRDWLAGWLQYFPILGGKTVDVLFDPATAKRLAWEAGSYYAYGNKEMYLEALANDRPASYLINTYVLAMPFKFIAVSLLLMWRGLFLAAQLGVLSLVSSVPVIRNMGAFDRNRLLLLAAPLVVMVVVNALVSVSIARYNLPLLIVYSIILGHVAEWLARLLSQAPATLRARLKRRG